ncbi:MAG TPA: hypothetical protein VM734_31990 [Kofleriaceae bacterium]|jgi:hypothetical protein|nr:hypothetical protein [Kofleriaceae bacterium]
MNAARILVGHLDRPALRRLAPRGAADGDDGARAAALAAAFELDLCGLLNRLRGDELAGLARRLKLADPDADAGAVRAALWWWGARLEAGGDHLAGSPVQPVPDRLGARLVHVAPARGLAPPAPAWPRPLPPPRPPEPPAEEPDDVDALLAAADRALGVRLPARGRDKGAWGAAAARLLGVVERGVDEPDWRGDVEVKTVPVARDRGGRWRVTEDPAVGMVDASPLAKLRRVLWLVRAACGDGATLLSWYFVEWDAEVARLVRRDLHTRPKGPRGTRGRGWYLHKRFFVDAGLYATLNGPRVVEAP